MNEMNIPFPIRPGNVDHQPAGAVPADCMETAACFVCRAMAICLT
jgi:hypothetical protein